MEPTVIDDNEKTSVEFAIVKCECVCMSVSVCNVSKLKALSISQINLDKKASKKL